MYLYLFPIHTIRIVEQCTLEHDKDLLEGDSAQQRRHQVEKSTGRAGLNTWQEMQVSLHLGLHCEGTN